MKAGLRSAKKPPAIQEYGTHGSEEIEFRERWASGCLKICFFSGHGRSGSVAAEMLGSNFSLMASLASYRRHGR